MRFLIFALACAPLAAGGPVFSTAGSVNSNAFVPATPLDSRSPCPLLNTLSNHGFMARSGLNISVDEMVEAMDVVLNLDPFLTRPIAELGATTSTTGINGTMNLADLNEHRVIEHDASLGRADQSTGNSLSVNLAIYSSVARNFGSRFITPPQSSFARIQRFMVARDAATVAAALAGPEAGITFFFDEATNNLSRAESAFYMMVFQDQSLNMTRTDWVNSMFVNEMFLPDFARPPRRMNTSDLDAMVAQLSDAENGLLPAQNLV